MISFEKLERNTWKIIARWFVTEEKIKNRFLDDNFNIYIVDKLLFQFLVNFSNLKSLICIKKRRQKIITCRIVKIK